MVRTGATAAFLLAVAVAATTFAANPLYSISQIQGNDGNSPLAGQAVRTTGVVTALAPKGFFLQDPQGDGNPATSDGVYVYTSSAPTVKVGDAVEVSAKVAEFQGLTELTGTTVTVSASGQPLPAPVELTATFPSPTGGINQLESVEGMRVHIASARTGGPTTSFGELPVVIPPHDRTYRERGILAPGLPGLPVWDGNPERLILGTTALAGSVAPQLSTDVPVSDITGVVDYNYGNYKIDVTSMTADGSKNLSARPVRARSSHEFTIASFNVLRMYDLVDDPNYTPANEPVPTPQDYDARQTKLARAIVDVMHAPEIVGFEEVETIQVLKDLAAKIQTLDPTVTYTPYLFEGNDVSGIDVGLMVRDNVRVLSVVQEGKDATYVNPTTNQPEMLNDRPPIVLHAEVCVSGSAPYPITVVVNHLRSMSGVDVGTDTARIRAKRKAQAEFLANLLQDLQTTEPGSKIAAIGDFNSLQVNDGFVDMAGIIKGAPEKDLVGSTDLVEPDFVDLPTTLPAAEQYSFVFNGDAQVLDHIFVNDALDRDVNEFAYARNNADFPQTLLQLDPSRPERVSDHDMPVAFVQTLSSPPTGTVKCN